MLYGKPGYQLFSIESRSRAQERSRGNEMQYYFYVLTCNPELIGISFAPQVVLENRDGLRNMIYTFY